MLCLDRSENVSLSTFNCTPPPPPCSAPEVRLRRVRRTDGKTPLGLAEQKHGRKEEGEGKASERETAEKRK